MVVIAVVHMVYYNVRQRFCIDQRLYSENSSLLWHFELIRGSIIRPTLDVWLALFNSQQKFPFSSDAHKKHSYPWRDGQAELAG